MALRHRGALPGRRGLVENAPVPSTAFPAAHPAAAEKEQHAQEDHASNAADYNASDVATTEVVVVLVADSGSRRRGGWMARGFSRCGSGESHGRSDDGQLYILAPLLRVRIVAAGVGGVSTAGRTIRAKPNGAVAIAAVVRFILGARDTGVGECSAGQRACGKVGPKKGRKVGIRVRTELPVRGDVRLTLRKLRTGVSTESWWVCVCTCAAAYGQLDQRVA